jgi:hypothetical protein
MRIMITEGIAQVREKKTVFEAFQSAPWLNLPIHTTQIFPTRSLAHLPRRVPSTTRHVAESGQLSPKLSDRGHTQGYPQALTHQEPLASIPTKPPIPLLYPIPNRTQPPTFLLQLLWPNLKGL